MDRPKIVLVGTGAVGSYYGARLSEAGARVSAVCRSDYDIVARNGIKITSVRGDFHFMPEEVVKDISSYSDIPDYIIVATKVLPEIDVPSMIRKGTHEHTSIVLLQNGIDIEGPVAAAFPKNEIICGLAFICVSRNDYGQINHQDYGRIILGRYPSGSSKKVEILARLFRDQGIPCEIEEDVIAARWKKLLWNAPFNPISVLGGGVNSSEMLQSGPTRLLVHKVMEEVVLLSEKTGHPIDRSLIEKNINDTLDMIPYKTSMLLDYENKRPMEVEAILGNAVRIARQYRVPVPYLEALYGLLHLADEHNRNPDKLK